jgi:DNA invertase Pin-like site-specific DNA recombinase
VQSSVRTPLHQAGIEKERTVSYLLNALPCTYRLIGYARVSTQDQTVDLQVERKGLDQALNYVREGGTLIVWNLDRLGRSLSIAALR